MKPDAICIFIGPSIPIFISGKPYLQRSLFQTNLKTIIFLFVYVCGHEMSLYFKFSYGNFNYRGESPNATPIKWRSMTLRQQVAWTSPSHVSAIICPNNLRLIIICRLGTYVRSILFRWHRRGSRAGTDSHITFLKCYRKNYNISPNISGGRAGGRRHFICSWPLPQAAWHHLIWQKKIDIIVPYHSKNQKVQGPCAHLWLWEKPCRSWQVFLYSNRGTNSLLQKGHFRPEGVCAPPASSHALFWEYDLPLSKSWPARRLYRGVARILKGGPRSRFPLLNDVFFVQRIFTVNFKDVIPKRGVVRPPARPGLPPRIPRPPSPGPHAYPGRPPSPGPHACRA
jgi:hypothetical protein